MAALLVLAGWGTAFAAVASPNPPAALSFVEEATRARVVEKDLRIEAVVFCRKAPVGKTALTVEVLDKKDEVLSVAQKPFRLAAGRNRLTLVVPLPAGGALNLDALALWRLRFRLCAAEGGPILGEGLVALGRFTTNLLGLRLNCPQSVLAGSTYRAYLQVRHPCSGRALAGVAVGAELRPEGADTPVLSWQGVSGHHGVMRIQIDLPADFPPGEAALTVRAARRTLSRQLETSVTVLTVPQVFLSTDKPLYQPGQALQARVGSASPRSRVLVELTGRTGVLAVREVVLQDGPVWVEFPYEPSFAGILFLTAQDLDCEPFRFVCSNRAIVYPDPAGDLALRLRPSRAEGRPGEELELELTTSGPDGAAVPALIGLAVTDRGIAERAREEAAFDSTDSFLTDFKLFRGEEVRLAGLSRYGLEHLKLPTVVPSDLDLAAEVLLYHEKPWLSPVEETAKDRGDEALLGLAKVLAERTSALQDFLTKCFPNDAAGPTDFAALQEALKTAGLPLERWRDLWGNPYRLRLAPCREYLVLTLTSDGPDECFDTEDDLVVNQTHWPYFRRWEKAVERAAKRFTRRTGRPVLEEGELRAELEALGECLEDWRDPWGQPFRVIATVWGRQVRLAFWSPGCPQKNDPEAAGNGGPFVAGMVAVDRFSPVLEIYQEAVNRFLAAGGEFPRCAKDFPSLLATGGVPPELLLDPWNQPVFACGRDCGL